MNWFQRLFCGHSIKGICRHSATYAALVYGERYVVRICGGQINGYAHSQAQAELPFFATIKKVDKYYTMT